MDILKNYIHLYLKIHKKNIIVLIINIYFGIGCIIAKFKCSKFDVNQNSFYSTQISKVDSPFFSKILFSLLNVHHSFSKLERILTMMIKESKAIEIDEIHFYNTFGSNMFLASKL